jgi:predicted P-loop ATPase
VPYGSTPLTWDHFATELGLFADMLPVISNPHAEISPNSKMQKVGKTPSVYNASRLAAGFPKWTTYAATENDVRKWRREVDYGICLQSRTVRAIDIDVPDEAFAQELVDMVEDVTGITLPRRSRAGTGKTLLGFSLTPPEDKPWVKRSMTVKGGIVEFLGDGQQFIADGTHEDGSRYEWVGGLPREFPELSYDQILAVWDRMVLLYCVGEPNISKERRARGDIDIDVSDERATWIVDNWPVFDVGGNGELFVQCPFEEEHTSDTGESSTAYFPAGTGGFERGHWKCLHAHCDARSDDDFDIKTGYKNSGLAGLPTPEPEPGEVEQKAYPVFSRDGKGYAEATRTNIAAFLRREDMTRIWLAYDEFLDQIVWAPCSQKEGRQQWRAFSDEHYVDVLMEAERATFKTFGVDLLRSSVLHAAKRMAMDSAKVWLSRQEWDGVPRVETFLKDRFGVEDGLYTRAVSRYIWSAHAGRIIHPGVQADMAPVYVGAQGSRKTTAIKAMSPSDDFYCEINLKARDDDLSRKLRGKLVGELEELRGLNSRESEEIKAWVSRTHEEWVPKYREFGSKFARRVLLHGSANVKGFLADPTGERRWLPMMVGTDGIIDPEGVAADRDQLWAEGAEMFRASGVDWRGAERLAKAEHIKFKVGDVWSSPVDKWMNTKDFSTRLSPIMGGFTTADALSGVGVKMGQANNVSEMRMNRVLVGHGLYQGADGLWRAEGSDHLPAWLQ